MLLRYLLCISTMFTCVDFTAAADNATSCVSRRCLASKLAGMGIVTQPQSPHCHIAVDIYNLYYQTINVVSLIILVCFISPVNIIIKYKALQKKCHITGL